MTQSMYSTSRRSAERDQDHGVGGGRAKRATSATGLDKSAEGKKSSNHILFVSICSWVADKSSWLKPIVCLVYDVLGLETTRILQPLLTTI